MPKNIKEYRVRINFIIVFLHCLFFCSIVNGEDAGLTAWEVIKGDIRAWKMEDGNLRCESTNEIPQWIISKHAIAGHWILEADINSSNSNASQGILFTVGNNQKYGYLLSHLGKHLTLSRIVQPPVPEIREDFENNLDNWQKLQGNPKVFKGKLVFTESLADGGNIGIMTTNYVSANQDIQAQVHIKNFTGTGGYQVNLDLTDGTNYVRIQRRGGAWGNRVKIFVNDGTRGWESQSRDISGQEFKLKITYDRSTGILTGHYDKMDGNGWIEIGTTANSEVTFSTWSKIGFPASDGGTIILPPHSPVRARLHAFGVNTYRMALDDLILGPDSLSNLEDKEEPIRIDHIQAITSWDLPEPRSTTNKLRISKIGGTYSFYVNDAIISTITNPSVITMEEFAHLQDKPEPDQGYYGFVFQGRGIHSVSNIRFRNIQLAEKYEGNPVLPPRGPAGSWDDGMIHTACIKKFENRYYLYYTGRSKEVGEHLHNEGGRIGVATSQDGYNFVPYEMNPVYDRIDPVTGIAAGNVQAGAVVHLNDGAYALTYTVHDGKRWHPLEYASGPTPVGPFLPAKHNPMLDTGNVESFDGEHIHLHDIQKLEDGSYAMLYTGFSIGSTQKPGGDKGGLATSSDFTTWVKYANNPVFPLGKPGSWDDGHVRPKGFVKYGQFYYMFYEGAHRSDYLPYFYDQVGMARSKDLVNWERFPHNPIIPIDAGGGRDTIVTEWPSPIITDTGIAVFYWGGSLGQVGISRADISKEVLVNWDE